MRSIFKMTYGFLKLKRENELHTKTLLIYAKVCKIFRNYVCIILVTYLHNMQYAQKCKMCKIYISEMNIGLRALLFVRMRENCVNVLINNGKLTLGNKYPVKAYANSCFCII